MFHKNKTHSWNSGHMAVCLEDYSLEKIDFSKLTVITPQSKINPFELQIVIERAVREKNFVNMQKIYNTLKENYSTLVSLERIVVQFYLDAIFANYNKTDFSKLLELFPIDIHQPILCRKSQSLVVLAAERSAQDITQYLIEQKASLKGFDKVIKDLQREIEALMAFPPKDINGQQTLDKKMQMMNYLLAATKTIANPDLKQLLEQSAKHLQNTSYDIKFSM